jgi:hypothetical protein
MVSVAIMEEKMAEAKQSKKARWLSVGCGVGLLVLILGGGIFALINSKHAVAKSTVQQIADQAALYYTEKCEFPPSAPDSSTIFGNQLLVPKYEGPGWEPFSGMPTAPQLYAYSTLSQGDTFMVFARGDVVKGGPSFVASITLTGEKASCKADMNELTVVDESH